MYSQETKYRATVLLQVANEAAAGITSLPKASKQTKLDEMKKEIKNLLIVELSALRKLEKLLYAAIRDKDDLQLLSYYCSVTAFIVSRMEALQEFR